VCIAKKVEKLHLRGSKKLEEFCCRSPAAGAKVEAKKARCSEIMGLPLCFISRLSMILPSLERGDARFKLPHAIK
jgi:hypothetical protein